MARCGVRDLDFDRIGQNVLSCRMAKKHSLYEAKSTAERHAELERAGLVHRVEGKPGQEAFPLGVKRAGALKRFLAERD